MPPAILYRLSPGVALNVWFDNTGFTFPFGVPVLFLGIVNGTASFRITATGAVVFVPVTQVQAISF